MQKCVHGKAKVKKLHESYLVITTTEKINAMLILCVCVCVEYVLICCQIVCKCV